MYIYNYQFLKFSIHNIFNKMGNSQERVAYVQNAMKGVQIIQNITSKLDSSLFDLEKKISRLHQVSHSHLSLMEPRFSTVEYPLINITPENKSKQKITTWCGLMTKQVFSVAFRLFLNNDLDQNEVKCYASQNFLYNFIRLSKWVDLSQDQIKAIQQKLKKIILPYIKTSYPQSKSSEVNLSLNQRIHKTDDLQNNQNDLFFKSGIQFKLHENKQYDPDIMKFFNYIINLPSCQGEIKKKYQNLKDEEKKEKIQQRQKTNNNTLYSDFQSFFGKLFSKLYSKEKISSMEKGQNSDYPTKQKIDYQYEEKVKGYTKFFINRKLSSNIETFSQQRIKLGNLFFNNSSLMRVATKWCEQLRRNFRQPDKVAHKHGQFRMKNGSTNYLSHGQAKVLQMLLERREKQIQIWISKVRQNYFLHQESFSKKNITKDADFAMISEKQSTVGMFAAVNHKNYQFYLISYLKQLLHHCLTVMNEFELICSFCGDLQDAWNQISKESIDYYIELGKGTKNKNQSILDSKSINLITFQVGDLFRCKCSSKQRQINAVYNQINRISKQNPKFLKIVKIKNRLDKGTKDVLINLLFQERILIQLQLAIDVGKSKFIECSDKFNHYIYEVERAEFGPISQFCSIWISKDLRSKFFLTQFQAKHKPKYSVKKEQTVQLSSEIKVHFPFQCSKQNKSFKCNRYGVNTFDFKNSDKYCVHCILEKNKYPEIKKAFPDLPDVEEIKEEVKRINYKEIHEQKSNFPNSGLTKSLKSKKSQVLYFKCIQRGKNKFLIAQSKQNLKFQNIGQISTLKQQERFLEQNLVLNHSSFKEKISKIKEKEIIKNYFIPGIFKMIEKNKKTSIKIMRELLNDENFTSDKRVYNLVESVNLSENNLKNFQAIAHKFPLAKVLILNDNKFTKIQLLERGQQLRQLNLSKNKISIVTKENVQNLKNIQLFFISDNFLQSLPSNISQMVQLRKLTIDFNKIQRLPDSFGFLTNLQTLDLQNNNLSELPKSFGHLINLQLLNLKKNNLNFLPQSFGSLQKLLRLTISFNKLVQLPEKFGELQNLQHFYVNDNNISSLPESFTSLENLKELNISKNDLNELPFSFGKLKKLQLIQANDNKLTSLPESFGELKKIQRLGLDSNNLSFLPQSFVFLDSLKELSLIYNSLQLLPESFGFLENLSCLQINSNHLKSLPESFGQLKNLQYLNLSSNHLLQLPSSFAQLNQLKLLFLHNNNLSLLCRSFGKLNNLQNLTLQNNKLNELPDYFDQFEKLEHLKIDLALVNEKSEVILNKLKNQSLKSIIFE